MEKLNNKAQLGLSTVKVIMIGFLVLGVIAVAIVLSITLLRDVTDKVDILSASVTNVSTVANVSSEGNQINVTDTNTLRNCALTVTAISSTVNSSCESGINSANFTVTQCGLNFASTSATDDGCYNNTLWNFTGSYSYNSNDINDLSTNISSGLVDFFNETGTIFSILIVIIIILAIAILIAVVSRFQGASGSAGGIAGSSSSNDTVTGS